MVKTMIYPTEHSSSRLNLAQSMLPLLLQNDNITAIVVGGSVGRGCADEYSDLEIGLVWAQESMPQDKIRLLETIGTPDQDDSVFIGGKSMDTAFKVDVIHTTTDEIEQALHNEKEFEELRGFLWASIPIHNVSAVKTWQKKLHKQFETNRPNLIQTNISRLTQHWDELSTIPITEYIQCRNKQIDIITTLIRIICFTQHQVGHSKWIHWSIKQTNPCFSELPNKLLSLFHHEPNDGFARLQEICLECMDLIVADSEIDLLETKKIIASSAQNPSVIVPLKIERLDAATAKDLLTEQLDMPWFALNRAIFYAKRQEFCIFYRMMEEYSEFVLRALCLINKIKPPLEDDPFAIQLLPHFKVAPTNFDHSLKSVFKKPLSEALETMHNLIEDTFDVVKIYMPDVDSTKSRHRFQHDRRKPWSEIPPLHT